MTWEENDNNVMTTMHENVNNDENNVMTESSRGGKPSGRVMEEMGKGEGGGRKAKMYLLHHSLDESCEGGL